MISYFPGCTLKTKARNLDRALTASLAALGIEVVELPRWNCCGVVPSLSDDDLLRLVAPVRDLVRAQQQGAHTLLTGCSMCYNVLAHANELMRRQPDKLATINLFMDEEPDYTGSVEVVHLLQLLERELGWQELAAKVKRPLKGLRVAAYYGCTLQRPRQVAIDRRPTAMLFEECLQALGAEVARFTAAHDCCGSYQIVSHPELAVEQSSLVISGAQAAGAELLVTSCPLCEYNLGTRQSALGLGEELPTVYLSQLLALALGLDPALCAFEDNMVALPALLSEHQLLGG